MPRAGEGGLPPPPGFGDGNDEGLPHQRNGRGPSIVVIVNVATPATPTNSGTQFGPAELETWTEGITPPLTRCADLSLLAVDAAGRL